jgi:hypothetical protein
MELKQNYKEFDQELINRGIDCLIHFTPTINLLSIYEMKKLMSRKLLEEFEVDQTDIFDYVEFTDNMRFDDKSYINLSVQHPNSYLFSHFRQKTAIHSHINWCVLKIDKKFIYEKSTLFSVTNAANGHNKRNVGITDDLDKFKKLFDNTINVVTSYTTRPITRNNLKDKYPTDEQAEVLVKNEIPIDAIIEVCFKDANDLAAGKAALSAYNTSNFIVDASLFTNSRT